MRKRILQAVLQVFNQPDIHPRADDLYLAAQNSIEGLDEKMFFEALSELEKTGKVETAIHGNNLEKRYHIRKDRHFHFICNQCGKVRDLVLEEGAVSMIQNYIQVLANSFARVDKVNMSFQGICHECQSRNL
jgi:Fe2+ or Zn2+ uptake regulation protein